MKAISEATWMKAASNGFSSPAAAKPTPAADDDVVTQMHRQVSDS